jgi:hypothetical protein
MEDHTTTHWKKKTYRAIGRISKGSYTVANEDARILCGFIQLLLAGSKELQMHVEVQWSKTIRLLDGSRDNLIYTFRIRQSLPTGPGIYIFARSYGQVFAPLYIGIAENLGRRIMQQLNNVKLMKGIEKAQAGHRFMLYGELKVKRGQQASKLLKLVETALIQYALAEGHELLNVQGVKTPIHVITNKGNRLSRQVAPLRMNVRIK